MTVETAPAISICIATCNRGASLMHLLRSLEAAQAAAVVDSEVVMVDNGSTDETATVLEQWAAAAARRVRLFVPQPGKSRALNHALAAARGALLAFTDDDVEVAPEWLQSIVAFCAAHPEYDAAMGRVLIPPTITDPLLLRRIAQYNTLPLWDGGDAVADVRELYGCNMVVRRHVFERIGRFDERLGPGASGWGEDTDLSQRAARAGFRLGYMPGAVVYHSVDPTRLTPEFFRSYHQRKANGDFLCDPRGASRKNLSRLIDASLRFAWCRLTGDVDRAMRARMRMIRQGQFLRLRWRSR